MPGQNLRARLAVRKARRLKEGGGLPRRTWDATTRRFKDGTVMTAGSYLATVAATWTASGAPGVRSEQWKAFLKNATLPIGTLAVVMKLKADSQRRRFSPTTDSVELLRRFVHDREHLRIMEYDLVRRYAKNPVGTTKLYRTDAQGLADLYAFLHRMREVPEGRKYRLGFYENRDFQRRVVPVLLYNMRRFPSLRGKEASVLREHRIKTTAGDESNIHEGNATGRLIFPQNIRHLIPSSLERQEPSTEHQTMNLALFCGAVALAKERKYKDGNRT